MTDEFLAEVYKYVPHLCCPLCGSKEIVVHEMRQENEPVFRYDQLVGRTRGERIDRISFGCMQCRSSCEWRIRRGA